MRRLRCVSAVAMLGLACASSPTSGGAADVADPAGPPVRPVSRHADVYLVPIGTTPPGAIEHLIAFYGERLQLEVVEARGAPFFSRLYDARRGQLVAEELLYLLEVWCEGLSTNPNAIYVGITDNDMYTRSRSQRFSYAHQAGGRFAVVSSAHLADGAGSTSPEVVKSRLRKIVTQAIGMLYFDLPLNDDPRSVLSSRVQSLADIDTIDESTLERDVLEADAARFR